MHNGRFFHIDENSIEQMKQQWHALLGHYTSDENELNKLFESMVRHYSEKGRYYHNLSHIKALLESSDSISDIENRAAVRLAIWFHDVIYETAKSDNEEKSAEMAVSALSKFSAPANIIEAVRDMILATKTHAADSLTKDAKIFLDLDLLILGTREEIYKAYSEAIRKEYSWVADPLYRNGRRKILESFLARKSIYFTEDLATRYDMQARHNIESELRDISG